MGHGKSINEEGVQGYFHGGWFMAVEDSYQLLQDTHGGQWYAISGTPSVEQRPVYQDGKPVYDGDKLRTYQVESVRYKTTPTPHRAPDRRSTEPKRRPSKKT